MVITLFTLTVIALCIWDLPNPSLPFLTIKVNIHCGTYIPSVISDVMFSRPPRPLPPGNVKLMTLQVILSRLVSAYGRITIGSLCA